MTRLEFYKIWQAMRRRCYNSRDESYSRYSGRGIRVCRRWLDNFENFRADMGPRPSSEYSLERINNDGNYTPKNCKWAPEILLINGPSFAVYSGLFSQA